MYNGIGLKTVRGTSTSGFVQRNKSHIKPSWRRKREVKQTAADVLRKRRRLDPELVLHEKKRQVEVRLCEERIRMEEEAVMSKDAVEEKIVELRADLLKKMEDMNEVEEGEISNETQEMVVEPASNDAGAVNTQTSEEPKTDGSK